MPRPRNLDKGVNRLVNFTTPNWRNLEALYLNKLNNRMRYGGINSLVNRLLRKHFRRMKNESIFEELEKQIRKIILTKNLKCTKESDLDELEIVYDNYVKLKDQTP